MQIIGLSGASGSGKSTVAGMLASELPHFGMRCAQDCFAAPIKWLCRATGWTGVMDTFWRERMQQYRDDAMNDPHWAVTIAKSLGEAMATETMVALAKEWAELEMPWAEFFANTEHIDKFVYWLAYRNGLGHQPGVGWYEKSGAPYHTSPDFLIIPDVRYPAEADFCQENGVLIHACGSRKPLCGKAAQHDSESHTTAMQVRADSVIEENPTSDRLARAVADAVAILMVRGKYIKKTPAIPS